MSSTRSSSHSQRSRRVDSKIPQLSASLRTLAMEKGPHARLPSVMELCRLFNTSRATIHETLDALEGQNVLYRKTGSGIFVSPKAFRTTLCILFSASYLSSAGTSPFWGMLLSHLAQIAQERGGSKYEYSSLHIVIRAPDQEFDLPEEVIQTLSTGNVYGVLAVGLDYAATSWIKAQDIPCIGFACVLPTAMVALDYAAMLDMAVQRLVEQGCRSIGLWTSSRYCPKNIVLKDQGFEEVPLIDYFRSILAKYNLPCSSELIQWYPEQQESIAWNAQREGYHLAQQVFDRSFPYPDGIVITNDQMTEGVLAAFDVLDIHPGKQVMIVTHGNAGASIPFEYRNGLTVLDFDARSVAQTMFSLMDSSQSEQPLPAWMVFLPPHFRTRPGIGQKGDERISQE